MIAYSFNVLWLRTPQFAYIFQRYFSSHWNNTMVISIPLKQRGKIWVSQNKTVFVYIYIFIYIHNSVFIPVSFISIMAACAPILCVSHGIIFLGQKDIYLPLGGILTIYIISVLRTKVKFKYRFMFYRPIMGSVPCVISLWYGSCVTHLCNLMKYYILIGSYIAYMGNVYETHCLIKFLTTLRCLVWRGFLYFGPYRITLKFYRRRHAFQIWAQLDIYISSRVEISRWVVV